MTLPKRRAIDVMTAAKMLQVSRMTICRWMEDGHLEGFRYHERGRWQIYLDTVERLANRRNGGEESAAQ